MTSNDEEVALYTSLATALVQRLKISDPSAGGTLRHLVLALAVLEGIGHGGLTAS